MDVNHTFFNITDMMEQLSQLGGQNISGFGSCNTSQCELIGGKNKSSAESTQLRKKGNEFYSKKKHDEADHRWILHFYSKSIAYAPPNSEELALAYSNRSVLWLHLKKFDLCLTDIGRAESITLCDKLKTKLSSRRQKCLDLIQSAPSQEVRKRVELPPFTPSKVVPCAADSITLKYDQKHGRHYVANRDLKPGEIVMIEESPYVSVRINLTYLICSHCVAFAWAGIPCDSCVFTIYCSETCKNASWKQYHETMCSKLPSLYYQFRNDDIFSSENIATRIMSTMLKINESKAIIKEATEMDEKKVMTMESLLSDGKLNCKGFRAVYNLSKYKPIDRAEPVTMESIFDKLVSIVKNNSYTFRTCGWSAPSGQTVCTCRTYESCINSYCTNRGSFLSICSSFLNHSCAPNVGRMFLPGPKIVIFTAQPVKKGEQICIYYGPSNISNPDKQTRQGYLEKFYSFSCGCRACRENWPFDSDDENSSQEIILHKQMEKIFGHRADMFSGPPHTWPYDKKTFKGFIKMSEFIHKKFNARDAYWHNTSPAAMYIYKYFHNVYGEKLDFPSSCET